MCMKTEIQSVNKRQQRNSIKDTSENYTQLLDFIRLSRQICNSEFEAKKCTVTDKLV